MTSGVGFLVGGRFLLEERIGQGGMGRVWRGHDQTLDRPVAVKEVLLPAGLSDSERADLVARMSREGKAAARLNHPGIVTIHDVVEHDGAPWIVMELVAGRSLGAELAAHGGRLPWERVADIGAKIADALSHAHALGIVHRDMKPDNVLIAGDRVVVTDFGIARIEDANSKLTATGTVMGTPQFMAPEQLEGAKVGPAADMWSLGATLYSAVEGRSPFEGSTLTAVIAGVLARDPAPPQFAGPMTEMLAQLLTKSPAARPAAEATAQGLRAAQAVQTTVVPQPVPDREVQTVLARPEGEQRGIYQETVSRPEPDQQLPGQPGSDTQSGLQQGGTIASPHSGDPSGSPRLATIGLGLAVVAGIIEVIGLVMAGTGFGIVPIRTESVLWAYMVVLIQLAAAVAALAAARKPAGRWLRAAALGSWFASWTWLLPDLLDVHGEYSYPFARFADTYSRTGSSEVVLSADVLGIAAVILMMAAARKTARRGGRWAARPRQVQLLLCGAALGPVIWYISSLYLFRVHNPCCSVTAVYFEFNKWQAVTIVEMILAVAVAVLVAVYALGLRDRVAGGAVLTGWLAVALFTYLQFVAEWTDPPVQWGAVNDVAGAVLIASVVLAIVYLRGKETEPTT
jgi:serine/threonine protein kinase